jgi:hypothetical protein
LGEAAKILDVDYAGRAEGVRSKGHEKYITEKRRGEAMRNCSGGACKKRRPPRRTIRTGKRRPPQTLRLRSGQEAAATTEREATLPSSGQALKVSAMRGEVMVSGFGFLLQSGAHGWRRNVAGMSDLGVRGGCCGGC